jgi:O-antigen/teichoic acid export membrane protein
MSLTQQIAKNTAIQLIGKIISTLLGLVAFAIMARSLGVEKFGWYSTAIGFLQMLGVISDFGFTAVTANMLSEPLFDKQKLINTLFTWRFITALFLQCLTPITILLFPYPWPIKLAVFVLSFSFFCVSLNNIFIGYFQNKLQMHWQTIGELTGRVVLVGGLLLVGLAHKDFIYMMVVITLASIAYTLYLWLKGPKINWGIDKVISKAIFKKIWPIAVAGIANAIYLHGDRFLLALYTNQIQVGLYGAAYRVIDIVAQTLAITMGIMMPLVSYAWSRNLNDEFKKRYQMSMDLMFLLALPMIAGIIALSTPIIKLIAGDKFAGAGSILVVLSVAIFGICFGMTFSYISLAIGQQKKAMWIFVTSAVLSLIAYLICIPRFGILGAAGVSIASEFITGFGLLIICSRYVGFWPELKTFFKILFSSIVMGAIIYYIQPLNVIISILIGIATYSVIIFMLKVVSKQTIKEIFAK